MMCSDKKITLSITSYPQVIIIYARFQGQLCARSCMLTAAEFSTTYVNFERILISISQKEIKKFISDEVKAFLTLKISTNLPIAINTYICHTW